MPDDPLVRVSASVSADGVAGELQLHRETGTVLAGLFPRYAAKLRGRQITATAVLRKLEHGHALDEADLEYAKTILGPAELKWARQQATAQRAEQLLTDGGFSQRLLPAPSSRMEETASASEAEADPDWVERLLEDVGVISDEILSELYARVLAMGSKDPATCSKRTLGVLRDLDRRGADIFGKALLVECGGAVPRNDDLLKAAGINYSDILDLDSYGLVDSSATVSRNVLNDDATFLTNNQRVVMVQKARGAQFPIYPLTPAGRDLKRVADIATDDALFEKLLAFIKNQLSGAPDAVVAQAMLPHVGWTGPAERLAWTVILEGKSKESASQ